MRRQRIVIVGGGVAAHRCATTLRAQGYDGTVTLISEEGIAPYDRTLLSKEFLSGIVDSSSIKLQPKGYADAGIDLLLGRRAVAVDPTAHRVAFSDGETVDYDRLVIATGARALRPGPFAASHSKVFALRDLEDAAALKAQLPKTRRLIVVGAGFIGCEVASVAVATGCEVVVVDRDPTPLAASVGHEAGSRLANLHLLNGIQFHAGLATHLRSVNAGVEVTLDNGSRLTGDALVVGAGMAADNQWCEAVGTLEVDAYGRTRVDNIWAAGDCTRRWSRREQRWLPNGHWHTAAEHGAAVGRAIVADNDVNALAPFDPVPYFWSHQHGLLIQWIGQLPAGVSVNELDIQFDDSDGAEDDKFVARYRHQGKLVAGLVTGQPRALASIRQEMLGCQDEAVA